MSTVIRSEYPSDIAAIEKLITMTFLDAAHTSHTEQLIVNALREAGQLSLSLVAEDNGAIVGYVAISAVSISDGSEGWYGLGPIAVAPGRQGQGIGSELMRGALDQLRGRNAGGCVVLGEPGFYGRFGFRVEPELLLPDVPQEYFQAVRFRGSMPSGNVCYQEAFNS